MLALIYLKGEHIKKDINKAIQYLQMAAHNNNAEAQNQLGQLYYENDYYITTDINESIRYFSLAVKQNNAFVQYNLGIIYLENKLFNKMKNIGIELLKKSLMNDFDKASFAVGFIYHEGRFVEQDIDKSIEYYLKASSFNNDHAKNNLGIIYKYGYRDKLPKKIEYAIVYFSEAIKQKNNPVSMYNLAHIYLYNDQFNDKIDESIQLLINSSDQGFTPSDNLLSIALIKKHGFNVEMIRNNLLEKVQDSSKLPRKICQMIINLHFDNESEFEKFYQKQKSVDFLYDYLQNIIYLKDLRKPILSTTNINNITSNFYEGFGENI